MSRRDFTRCWTCGAPAIQVEGTQRKYSGYCEEHYYHRMSRQEYEDSTEKSGEKYDKSKCWRCGEPATWIFRTHHRGAKPTGFCDVHRELFLKMRRGDSPEHRNVRRYTYQHDFREGDPEYHKETMEIERLPYDGKFYTFIVRTTDATDYERLQGFGIVGSYLGNPTFKRASDETVDIAV